MTFSDKKLAEFVNKNFIPAWETVAPVSLATFDLGDGKKITGAYKGNVALYICSADGNVIDILPALHPPTMTLQWLDERFKLYNYVIKLYSKEQMNYLAKYHDLMSSMTGIKKSSTIATHLEPKKESAELSAVIHMAKKSSVEVTRKPEPTELVKAKEILKMVSEKSKVDIAKKPVEPQRVAPEPKKAIEAIVGKSLMVFERKDGETKTVTPEMPAKKPIVDATSEDGKILVVVAGGMKKYSQQVHEYLARSGSVNPDQCKNHVFEVILGEKLESRNDVFVTDDPVSIAIDIE